MPLDPIPCQNFSEDRDKHAYLTAKINRLKKDIITVELKLQENLKQQAALKKAENDLRQELAHIKFKSLQVNLELLNY